MSALAAATRPTDQTTDDLDLVAAVRAGDDRAFELLWTRYQGQITRFVRSKVHDDGRAEDITQDVFVSAFRRMRETDREIIFRPWIYEIAKNACIDAFRRSRAITEVSFDAEDALGSADHGRLADSGSAPDAVIDTKLAIDNLRGAMGEMSEREREILVMREFEGLSYREIGERLGMSGSAVESQLFRARRKLHEEYDEHVSGARCVRVRSIVDAGGSRAAGRRDRRCLARHVSHCQPCRRYALRAGVDVEALRIPAAVRIAALMPLPAFLRRRVDPDEAGQVFGAHSPALNVVTTLDPATVSGWSKAVVTAATVAVAGLGAGAAVKHEEITDFISRAPGMVGLSPDAPAAKAAPLNRAAPKAASAGESRSGAGDIVVDQRTGRISGRLGGQLVPPAARDRAAVAPGQGTGAAGGPGGAATGETESQDGQPARGGTSQEQAPAGESASDDPAAGLNGLLEDAGNGATAGASVGAGAINDDSTAAAGAQLGDAVNGIVSGLTGAVTGATGAATGTGSVVAGDTGASAPAAEGATTPALDIGGALTTVISQTLGGTAGST
jgi:RNA polymerase sigma factor (sigma-70 family)